MPEIPKHVFVSQLFGRQDEKTDTPAPLLIEGKIPEIC